MTTAVPQGITENDIADYLANTPAFFERHAELLASIQLQSPFGQRAVSLQERQMEMLRERIKGLEKKIVEMIRNGQDNVAITDRLHRWTRALMLTTEAAQLPEVTALEEEAAGISGQRDSIFRGEMLRGALLSTFAWSTIGQIAGYAAIAACIGALVMAGLVIAGVLHLSKTAHA